MTSHHITSHHMARNDRRNIFFDNDGDAARMLRRRVLVFDKHIAVRYEGCKCQNTVYDQTDVMNAERNAKIKESKCGTNAEHKCGTNAKHLRFRVRSNDE